MAAEPRVAVTRLCSACHSFLVDAICQRDRERHQDQNQDKNRRDGESGSHAGRNGLACAVVMSTFADDTATAYANTAPMTQASVMSPRLRDKLSMPEITPR